MISFGARVARAVAKQRFRVASVLMCVRMRCTQLCMYVCTENFREVISSSFVFEMFQIRFLARKPAITQVFNYFPRSLEENFETERLNK